jgi:hypothetical protein
MRVNGQLQRRNHIGLSGCVQCWKTPLLILKRSLYGDLGPKCKFALCGIVRQAASLDEIRGHCLQAIAKLHLIARREATRQPSLATSACTANPTSQKVPVVNVAGTIAIAVVVNEPWPELLCAGYVETLRTQL